MSERNADVERVSQCDSGAFLRDEGSTAIEALEGNVEELVLNESHRLAKALVRSAVKGRVQSLKFLYELLVRRRVVAAGAHSRSRPSIAEILAAEPEWTEEDEKALAAGVQGSMGATCQESGAEHGRDTAARYGIVVSSAPFTMDVGNLPKRES